MPEVVIYAVGSPLVVDYEASLNRAGVKLRAAIKNHAGESYLVDQTKLVDQLADIESLRAYPFVIPLFTPGYRQQASIQARDSGFNSPFTLIDPSVPALFAVKCHPGVYVNAGCVLGAACALGDFALINRGASLGHHANLAAFVSIGPSAVVAGHVSIGKGAVVGAGAVVLPQITIGANAVVAAGAVVTKDVPPHTLVAGNPARAIKSDIAGYGDRSVE